MRTFLNETEISKNGIDTQGNSSFRLLVMAPNSWLGRWVNRQQLFSRLGRNHPVLYSTGGWHAWDRNTPEWKQGKWMGDITRHNNVWVDESPKFLARVPKIPPLDNLMLQSQAHRLTRFLRDAGTGKLVAYIFHPQFLPYVNHINPDYLVYHVYDMYDHTPGWNSTLDRDERELLQRSDLVIASSEQMAEGLREKVAREVRVLPNGADIESFDRALACKMLPKDLNAISKPRLGWVGSLHPQVDYGLIAELARRRSDWNFILVGQVISFDDERAKAERTDCETLPNVHFLGGKEIDEIPDYVANMDINLMCYRLSDQMWIKAGYPLKLHEYLAVGHPVVSADVPSVRPFANVVRIAHDTEGWLAAIEDALDRGGVGTSEQRRLIASENSWDIRVAKLESWLTELVSTVKFEE